VCVLPSYILLPLKTRIQPTSFNGHDDRYLVIDDVDSVILTLIPAAEVDVHYGSDLKANSDMAPQEVLRLHLAARSMGKIYSGKSMASKHLYVPRSDGGAKKQATFIISLPLFCSM
jgi:hypothetical protein